MTRCRIAMSRAGIKPPCLRARAYLVIKHNYTELNVYGVIEGTAAARKTVCFNMYGAHASGIAVLACINRRMYFDSESDIWRMYYAFYGKGEREGRNIAHFTKKKERSRT